MSLSGDVEKTFLFKNVTDGNGILKKKKKKKKRNSIISVSRHGSFLRFCTKQEDLPVLP